MSVGDKGEKGRSILRQRSQESSKREREYGYRGTEEVKGKRTGGVDKKAGTRTMEYTNLRLHLECSRAASLPEAVVVVG